MTPGGAHRPGEPSSARVTMLAVAAAAVACAVRLAVLRDMDAANPLFRVPILDEAVYLREARGFAGGETGPGTAPPLVSLLWSRVLAVLGIADSAGASVLNLALGSATAALAAAAAARWARSLVAGAVAGAIVALSGALVFQDTTAGIETLLGLLTLAAGLALVRAAVRPTHGRWATAGAAVAAAALGRMTHAALALAALPGMFRRPRAPEPSGDGDAPLPPRRNVLLHPFPWAALACLVLGWIAIGRAPASWGVNLWLGNCAWSRATLSFGTDEFPMDPDGELAAVTRIASEAAGRDLGTAGVNRWWLRRAWDEASGDPSGTVAFAAQKTLLLFYAPDMGGNRDADVEREFSPLLGVLPVSGAWILIAGIAGWMAARRRLPGAGTAALVVVSYAATLVAVFPLTRYRTPILPFAAVLAGVGAAAVAQRGRWDGTLDAARAPHAWRRDVAIGLVTALALTGASFGASAMRPATHAVGWTNLGLAEADLASRTPGGTRDSDRFFRRALEDTPGFAPAAAMRGVAALAAQNPAAALRFFDTALENSGGGTRWTPAERDAAQGRCRALSALGRHADALASHEMARRRFPDDAEIAIDGVFLALAAGDPTDAARRLETARRVAPGHPRLADAERATGR